MNFETEAETPTNSRNSNSQTVKVAIQSLNEIILYGAVEVPPTPESGLSSPYAAHFVLPANVFTTFTAKEVSLTA